MLKILESNTDKILEAHPIWMIGILFAFALFTAYYSGLLIGLFSIVAVSICVISPIFTEQVCYFMNMSGFFLLMLITLLGSSESWRRIKKPHHNHNNHKHDKHKR